MFVLCYICTQFSEFNKHFICLADTMDLEDFLKKDPKPSRTRRIRKKDKKKLYTIREPPTQIQEVHPSEPDDVEEEVPLVRKKPKTPTEKGVTFKEALPPMKPKMAEVEGKGKEKVIEPTPKKQKLTHTPSQPPAEPEVRFRVDIKRQLSLHARAGPLGQGISMDSVNRVFHSMNILGGDIWDMITDENPANLNKLGIHTTVVVSLLIIQVPCLPRYLHPRMLISSFFFYSEHHVPGSSPRCHGLK